MTGRNSTPREKTPYDPDDSEVIAEEAKLWQPHPRFEEVGIANLETLKLILWGQIERTSEQFKFFRPSVADLCKTIDHIRLEAKEDLLSKQWHYGSLLWCILDRPSQIHLNHFHKLKNKLKRMNTHYDQDPYRLCSWRGFFTHLPNLHHENLNNFLDSVARYSRMPPVSKPKPILRWTEGLPKNEDYYWDEAVPTEEVTEGINAPPHYMNLSDAWTAKIVETRSFTGSQRHQYWPQVFASKYLHQNYIMKGQPAKMDVKDDDGTKWYYKVVFGIWQLHGDEGEERDYPRDVSDHTNTTKHNNHNLHKGHLCFVQNSKYNFEKAKKVAAKKGDSSKKPEDTAPETKKRTASPSDANTKRLKKDGATHKTRSATGNTTIGAEFLRKTAEKPEPENPSDEVVIKKEPIYQPFVFEDSDSELEVKEVDACDDCARMKKEIDLLKDTLSRTQGKLVALSTATERIHGMVTPLLAQHKSATKLIRGAAKLSSFLDQDHKQVKDKKADIESIKEYQNINKPLLDEILNTLNTAQEAFAEECPDLAAFVFVHDKDGNPSAEFEEWKKVSVPDATTGE